MVCSSTSGTIVAAGAGLSTVTTSCSAAHANAAAVADCGVSSWATTTSGGRSRASSAERTCVASRALLAPGAMRMRLAPRSSTQIGATPVAVSATTRMPVVSTPLAVEVGDGLRAQRVVAHASDERHPGTEAGGHDGLVRPLAAEALLVAIGHQRLALVGHTTAVGDLVDVHRTDDDHVDGAEVLGGEDRVASLTGAP